MNKVGGKGRVKILKTKKDGGGLVSPLYYFNLKNALIIHDKNTKEITTVK